VVSCAKTAELIEILFGLWARMDPRNRVLDRGPDPPWEGAILRGKGWPIVKCMTFCTKMAESVEMPFGIWTQVGPRKHVLGEAAHWPT